MTGPARTIVLLAAAVNVLAVPVLGRLTWRGMETLNADGSRVAAVLLSLGVAVAIFAVNAGFARALSRTDADRRSVAGLWFVAVMTFGLTIGTGFFSPINLLVALVLT